MRRRDDTGHDFGSVQTPKLLTNYIVSDLYSLYQPTHSFNVQQVCCCNQASKGPNAMKLVNLQRMKSQRICFLSLLSMVTNHCRDYQNV